MSACGNCCRCKYYEHYFWTIPIPEEQKTYYHCGWSKLFHNDSYGKRCEEFVDIDYVPTEEEVRKERSEQIMQRIEELRKIAERKKELENYKPPTFFDKVKAEPMKYLFQGSVFVGLVILGAYIGLWILYYGVGVLLFLWVLLSFIFW